MTIPGLSQIDPAIKQFIEEKKHGIILYDLFPDSNITVFHRIKVQKKKSNGVIILGNEEQLEFLSRIVYDKLLSKERRDGFWGGIIEDENKLILIYSYYKDQSEKAIIELLSLKFRDDLVYICELLLSKYSFLQIKLGGKVIKSCRLEPKESQNATTILPFIKKPGIIYH